MGIESKNELLGHPVIGHSCEGFVIAQIVSNLRANRKISFYGTYDQSELDLVIERGGQAVASNEIKWVQTSDLKKEIQLLFT